MGERTSWAVLGYGNIGSEVGRQIMTQPAVRDELGLEQFPDFVTTGRRGLLVPDCEDGWIPGEVDWDERVRDDTLPDLLFLTTPPTPDGRPALDLMRQSLGADRKVITAEKSALANHFEELRDESYRFRYLGYTAAVGGGTRIIDKLRRYTRNPGDIKMMRMVVNGTTTFAFSTLAESNGTLTAEQVAAQALELGYAEPGASSLSDILRSEIEGDIPKKLSILFNSSGLSEKLLDWHDVQSSLDDNAIEIALNEARDYRFIASISPVDAEPDNVDAIEKLEHVHDGWRIQTAFLDTQADPLLSFLGKLKNAENGFAVSVGPKSDPQHYFMKGPGAGAKPTVRSMLYDVRKMNQRVTR